LFSGLHGRASQWRCEQDVDFVNSVCVSLLSCRWYYNHYWPWMVGRHTKNYRQKLYYEYDEWYRDM